MLAVDPHPPAPVAPNIRTRRLLHKIPKRTTQTMLPWHCYKAPSAVYSHQSSNPVPQPQHYGTFSVTPELPSKCRTHINLHDCTQCIPGQTIRQTVNIVQLGVRFGSIVQSFFSLSCSYAPSKGVI